MDDWDRDEESSSENSQAGSAYSADDTFEEWNRQELTRALMDARSIRSALQQRLMTLEDDLNELREQAAEFKDRWTPRGQ